MFQIIKVNYQLSIINHQFLIYNYQLSNVPKIEFPAILLFPEIPEKVIF